ncbi:MAG: N-glycosylase/DNA lyase, partial [Candidatus Nanohalobium sp.]
ERIKDFRELQDADEERIFQELVFVILTSQTGAEKAWEAAEQLEKEGLLLRGEKSEIEEVLADNGVQYEKDKAKYIVENRKSLSQPTLNKPEKGLKLKSQIEGKEPEKAREWLVKSVKGLSWKGSSHFLRNIGYGKDFAIISGHIVRKMHQLGLIDEPELPENKEEYLKYEDILRRFSDEIDIPLEELDLVLWSMETGEVFK